MIWQTKKIGEVCDFYNGLWKGKKPPYAEVGVIRNTNFTKDGELDDSDIAYLPVEKKQLEKRKLVFGDIILEKSGGGPKQPVGRVIIFNKKDGIFSFSNFTSAIRIKDKNKVDYNYLHKFLFFSYISGITESMQSHSTGIRNLDLHTYKEIEISIPPPSEQKRIVKILDEVFNKIEKVKENAEKNLKNSKKLFESYLQSVFANPGKDWKGKTLGEIVETTQGVQIVKNLQAKNPKIGYRRYLYISDFNHEKNLKYVQDIYPKKLVTPDDLIVVNTGASSGKIYRGIDGILSNNLFKVSFSKDVLDTDFLYYFVTSSIFINFQKKIVRGTANPHMGHENFNLTPFALPKLSEQKSIVKRIDELLIQTKKLEKVYKQKLADLEELKKSVLKKAFTGEL